MVRGRCDMPCTLLTVYLPFSVLSKLHFSVALNLWDYIDDIESHDSLHTKQFSRTNDSLLYNYNNVTGLLTFSAETGFGGIVYFNVTVIDDSGAYHEDTLIVRVISIVNSIDDLLADQIPQTYILSQNHPNPFNPLTTIRYGFPKASYVKLEIYNILGQRITTLVESHKIAGYHEFKLVATQLASGIYIFIIQAGEFNKVKKMVIMK